MTIERARMLVETSRLMGVDFVPVCAPSAAVGGAAVGEAVVAEGGAESGRGGKAARLSALLRRYRETSVVAQQIKGWHNIVFHDGDPDAHLMFVGEAPGEDEDIQGVPFVGKAGQLLNKMVTAMGLDRQGKGAQGVYVANVLKVRPPNNRTPTPDEAASDGEFLKEQIRIVSPRVIVTLGRPAANYLIGGSATMGSMRGKWHDFEGVPLMPTYHPAYLLRSYTPENRRMVWEDLQLAMGKLEG